MHDYRSPADIAYESSRDSFENYRDKLNDKALAAHESGNESLAQELLSKSNKLVYTGLMWEQDNGIE
jgi:phage shock protein A